MILVDAGPSQPERRPCPARRPVRHCGRDADAPHPATPVPPAPPGRPAPGGQHGRGRSRPSDRGVGGHCGVRGRGTPGCGQRDPPVPRVGGCGQRDAAVSRVGSAPPPGAQVSGVGLSRGPAAPRAGSGPGRVVRARYAILVDPQTGAVLWGRRSRTPVPPASLTKMLTALAVRASLDLDAVTVASKTAAAQPARRLAMKRGQQLTVDQALKALMIVSANDVAVMLAEAAGGSVARFARAMDAESARLGLRASSRRNPHGLDARGHRSTAFDLAILARAVLQDPWLARVVRKRHAAFISPSGRHHTLTARSRFLLGYRGAVGVKTGFTDDAGHCLAAAATR